MTQNQAIDSFEALRPSLERFRRKISSLVEDLIESLGIEIVKIESRIKTPDSFREKVHRDGKSYKDPINEITDLVGVRVICYFNEDVDTICGEIRKEFSVNESISVDKEPKFNELGYTSKHLIVSLGSDRASLSEYRKFQNMCCEIQVRTVAQHTWAAIEHKYNYKYTEEISESAKRRLFRIQAVLAMCDDEFSRLRGEIATGREELTERISHGDRVPIHAESLIAFMDSGFPAYEYIFSELRKRGFAFRKRELTERVAFAAAADRLRSFGIEDILGFEAMLNELDKDRIIKFLEFSLKDLFEVSNKAIKQTDVIHLLVAWYHLERKGESS